MTTKDRTGGKSFLVPPRVSCRRAAGARKVAQICGKNLGHSQAEGMARKVVVAKSDKIFKMDDGRSVACTKFYCCLKIAPDGK